MLFVASLLLMLIISIPATYGQNPKRAFVSDNENKVQNTGKVCARWNIDGLFSHKANYEKKLKNALKVVQSDKKISERDKTHRLKAIKLFHRELNDSVISFFNSIENIRSLLKGDFRSIMQLQETSKRRLEQLKSSMVEAEEEYNIILDAQKEELMSHKRDMNSHSNSLIKKFVDDLVSDISVAADELESKLDDGSFGHELHSNSNNDIEIETVVKVSDHDGSGDSNEGVIMLIDSDSNHYVLSKPKDSTTTHIDHALLKDIILLTMVAFVLTIICSLVKLPSMFASIVTGVILGPSGGGYLKSVVQIETFGEFGVFFILFCVGMEFSPDKIRKVLHESVFGTIGMTILFLVIGLVFGAVFGFSSRQIIFVAICLSFTSTPVVSKLLDAQKSRKDREELNEDYSSLLMSMLIIQDLILGIFMAILPILAGHTVEKSHSFASNPGYSPAHSFIHSNFGGSWEVLIFTTFELIFSMLGLMLLTYFVSQYVASRYFRGLSLFGSPETFVLGIITAMCFMLSITNNLGVSMELGCFVCGFIISTLGETMAKQVLHVVDPFKDFFSCLFFASIGFHVFPSLLLSEIAIFIPITAVVVAIKFLGGVLVFIPILPRGDKSKWLIAAALAQISEFSFVLGSRARRFGLIGREVYLIILSVTTLSLLISPFMWRTVHASITHSHGKWTVRGLVKKLIWK